MSKLFIIGNGFDLNHDFKTRYTDFRDWLKNYIKVNNYNDFSYIPKLPDLIQNKWGDYFPDINENKS